MPSAATNAHEVSAPVQPGVHEFGAQALFADPGDGLSPFFAIATQFDEALGNETTFEAAGHVWQLNHEEKKVKAWEGKIAAREEDTFDAFREYNIGVVAVDDVGRRRVNFQFRPSLPEARHVETGDRIKSMPKDLPEGIRVQIDAANVEPAATLDVLQALAELLDVNPRYFERSKVDRASVTNLAVYVRIQRDLSEERIVGPEGLLERLAVFCPRRPGQGEYVWDNEELMGHRNAVSLNPTALRKLYPSHAVGKLLKSYHMKHPKKTVDPGTEPDDPTYHPKLEVQYSQKYSPPEHQSVPWAPAGEDAGLFDAAMLRERLERHLLHALDWAGIDLDADAEAYVEDAYWSPRPADEPAEIHTDPTDGVVEAERELATNHFVNADLPPAQREAAKIMTNGGPMRVDRVAEMAGVSQATVYRMIQKLDTIVELIDGEVTYADKIIRTRVKQLFEILDRDIDRALKRTRKIITRATGEAIEGTVFEDWLHNYGAEILDDEELVIQVAHGELSDYEIWRAIKTALRTAGDVGSRTRSWLEGATIRWHDEHGDAREASISTGYGSETRFLGGRIDDQLPGERLSRRASW